MSQQIRVGVGLANALAGGGIFAGSLLTIFNERAAKLTVYGHRVGGTTTSMPATADEAIPASALRIMTVSIPANVSTGGSFENSGSAIIKKSGVAFTATTETPPDVPTANWVPVFWRLTVDDLSDNPALAATVSSEVTSPRLQGNISAAGDATGFFSGGVVPPTASVSLNLFRVAVPLTN